MPLLSMKRSEKKKFYSTHKNSKIWHRSCKCMAETKFVTKQCGYMACTTCTYVCLDLFFLWWLDNSLLLQRYSSSALHFTCVRVERHLFEAQQSFVVQVPEAYIKQATSHRICHFLCLFLLKNNEGEKSSVAFYVFQIFMSQPSLYFK